MITADIDAVTLKALAKDPADRYQSAREMKADITRVLAGQQATAVVPRIEQDAMATRRARHAATQTQVAPPPPPTMLAPMAEGDEEEPEEEERKSRVGLAVLVTVIILLVLGGGAYALYQVLTPNQTTVEQVEVPIVLTYTDKQATEQLEARGSQGQGEVGQRQGRRDQGHHHRPRTRRPGPGPGRQYRDHHLERRAEDGRFPDGLVGKDLDDVTQELEEAGFTNVDTEAAKEEDPDNDPNEVLTVSPKSGASIALDAKITVTYATGKSPVPNFVGVVESRARDPARDSGFDSVEVVTETSTSGATPAS